MSEHKAREARKERTAAEKRERAEFIATLAVLLAGEGYKSQRHSETAWTSEDYVAAAVDFMDAAERKVRLEDE